MDVDSISICGIYWNISFYILLEQEHPSNAFLLSRDNNSTSLVNEKMQYIKPTNELKYIGPNKLK